MECNIRQQVETAHSEQSQNDGSRDVLLRAQNFFPQVAEIVEAVVSPHGRNQGGQHIYFHTLPFALLARSQHVASDVVQSFAGSRGAVWLTVAMAVSALGALHVVVLTGARIPYAMARDDVFSRFAKRIHPSFRTPGGALIFLGSLGALLALSGTFEELYSLFIFAVWISSR